MRRTMMQAEPRGVPVAESFETATTTTTIRYPLVSIVMPIYGVQEFLDQSVGAALAQTYANLEVILVDDGSVDACPRMCDEWARRDPRVRVIHRVNGGLSAARNTGLEAAKGDYIYFMDPDDLIEPRLVRTCLEEVNRYAADLVMFRFDTIGVSGEPLESSYKHNDYDAATVLTPQEAIKKQLQSEINGYFWAFIAPAATYKDHDFSFPVGRKIEDLARICNVIGESKRIVRIPDVLYHYRLRGGSVLGSFKPAMIGDWLDATQDREDYIEARYPQLHSFMLLNSLNPFANLDYETIQQTIKYSLKLDPESQKSVRQRFEHRMDELKDAAVPRKTRKLVESIRTKADSRQESRDDDET